MRGKRSLGLRGESSSSKRAACIILISRSALYHSSQLHWPQHFAITLHQWLHHEAISHWFIASQWQQGRGHVNCSIQILPEAESAASGWIVIWAICHREPSGIDPKVAAVGDSSQMCLLTERVCLVSFSSGTSCFDDRWSPLVRSPTKNARKADPDCLIS